MTKLLLKILFCVSVAFIALLYFLPAKQEIVTADPISLEKYLRDFLANQDVMKYPIEINEFTQLESKEIVNKSGKLFIKDNLKFDVAQDDFDISIDELAKNSKNAVMETFCLTLQEREKLLTGFSKVGLIQQFVDVNNEDVVTIIISPEDCI